MEQFNDIYKQHYTSIYRLVSKFRVNSHEAEDIVQDVFVKLYLQFNSGNQVQYPKTWLYKVAVNVCINTVNRRKETEALESISHLEYGMSNSLESDIDQNEQEEIIRNALMRLKEQERLVVILYSEGLSYKEIAEVSGVKFTSISQNLSRALEKLRPLLKNHYYEMLNQ